MPVQGPSTGGNRKFLPHHSGTAAQRRPHRTQHAEQLLAQVGARCSRILLSYMLLISGAILCLYVLGTYIWIYEQQRELLHQWSESSVSESDALTKLSIPRIHLEAVVLEGVSRRSLLRGPARLIQSALPGADGNLVIAGHRDTFFRHVHQLRYGDDIYVMRGAERYHYTVFARRIVDPNDLSVLAASREGHLTLITCYPTNAIGPAPQRLIVVARLTGEKLLAISDH